MLMRIIILARLRMRNGVVMQVQPESDLSLTFIVLDRATIPGHIILYLHGYLNLYPHKYCQCVYTTESELLHGFT